MSSSELEKSVRASMREQEIQSPAFEKGNLPKRITPKLDFQPDIHCKTQLLYNPLHWFENARGNGIQKWNTKKWGKKKDGFGGSVLLTPNCIRIAKWKKLKPNEYVF